jgi:transcriptional regulator with XRE-family HTH domain
MDDSIRSAFRDILRQRRVSQAELAEMSGLRPDYVSKVLRGESGNMPDSWKQMLNAMGLELVVQPKATTDTVSWDRKEP